MSRRAPLSAPQSVAYSMGRVLVLFDVWEDGDQRPLDVERAMLIDFAAQQPRALKPLVPALERVLRAYRLHQADLSDLFAERQFDVLRERFSAVITDLLARDLLKEIHDAEPELATAARFALTERGRAIAGQFSSVMSLSFRALYEVLCETWRRKNVGELARAIRVALPQQARGIAELSVPIPTWLGED